MIEQPCTPDFAVRRDLAVRIAKSAGARAKSFLSRPEELRASEKSSSQDLVSAADKMTEAHLRRMIKRSFPFGGVVGEEAGRKTGASGFD
ncbi:inositol monophosphatase family protein [Rhizobium sp. AN70]|uniref:inositol monophosphatase family protein n=1 Tax=Rhizobium sp. AN70 TaxID=3035123 RepID=UPI0024784F58|nr:inositol monophosphatase family protein [Rhizobium sp. AN70]MDH7803278.1 fructose-1,6-bisphosphatase/inositol monophosphatase family enzyme [Rhizobium sp. AN70]